MRRIKDKTGVVHFEGANGFTLCGRSVEISDLLGGKIRQFVEAKDPVNCPDCAKLYCQIKNQPWNALEKKALEVGMYAAAGVAVGPEGVPNDGTDYTGTPWEHVGHEEYTEGDEDDGDADRNEEPAA